MGYSLKPWIGLTAVIALLIVVIGWFLVISPTQTATADTLANIESEQNRTVQLTTALNTLKAQYEDLDASRAELDDISVQVPSTAETADFRRTLVARATTSGVTILSLTTGLSTAVDTAPAPTEPSDTTGDAAATDTEAAASPSPSPDPTEPGSDAPAVPIAAGQALVGIPLEITVLGTYASARSFIASLQTVDGRLFVVSGLGLVTQLDMPASAGRSATAAGDVEFSISGFLIVLTAETTAPSDPEDEVITPELPPLPSTERNPFAPVSTPAS